MQFEVLGCWCNTRAFISRICQIIGMAPRSFRNSVTALWSRVAAYSMCSLQCVHSFGIQSARCVHTECYWEGPQHFNLKSSPGIRNCKLKVFRLMMITIKSEKIFSIMKLNLTLNFAKFSKIWIPQSIWPNASRRIPLFGNAIVIGNVFGAIFRKLWNGFRNEGCNGLICES